MQKVSISTVSLTVLQNSMLDLEQKIFSHLPSLHSKYCPHNLPVLAQVVFFLHQQLCHSIFSSQQLNQVINEALNNIRLVQISYRVNVHSRWAVKPQGQPTLHTVQWDHEQNTDNKLLYVCSKSESKSMQWNIVEPNKGMRINASHRERTSCTSGSISPECSIPM